LAITGDMVNLAAQAEIPLLAQWLKTVGVPDDVSVIPGNHDAYVPGSLKRCLTSWRPYMEGDEAQLTARAQPFPYLRVRGPVAIIACSTAIATPPFSANGYFGPRQARRTAEMLQWAEEKGLFRVVLIHHPPIRGATKRYKRMAGIGRFGNLMKAHGAELVLHGHTHLNTHYRLPGKSGDVPVIGIASASQGPGSKRPPSAYNLFSIDGEKGNWSLKRERFSLGPVDGEGFSLELTETL
jgi:3',5'-cyclic AMP phosphodiesterase CpdA